MSRAAPSPLSSAGPPVWDVSREVGLGTLPPVSGELKGSLTPLRQTLARVLVRARGADLVFVGRSPEPLRAYLGGLLAGVEVPWTVTGLNVSLLNATLNSEQQMLLWPLLDLAGLNPRDLVRGSRRAALVDVVASGGTFMEVHGALRHWASWQGIHPTAVRRRVALIGVIRAGTGRPGSWRWAAQPAFQGLDTGSVLVDHETWSFLAEQGDKVAPRWPPEKWAERPTTLPERTEQRMQALAHSRALYLLGQHPAERAAMSAALTDAGAQAQSGLRVLALSWRVRQNRRSERRACRLSPVRA